MPIYFGPEMNPVFQLFGEGAPAAGPSGSHRAGGDRRGGGHCGGRSSAGPRFGPFGNGGPFAAFGQGGPLGAFGDQLAAAAAAAVASETLGGESNVPGMSAHARATNGPVTTSARACGRFVPAKFDVFETDKDYVVQGEVPGVAMSDLKIEWDNDALKISGTFSSESHRGDAAPEAAAGQENINNITNEAAEAEKQPADEAIASSASSLKGKTKQASVQDEDADEDAVVVDAVDSDDESQHKADAEAKHEEPQQQTDDADCGETCKCHAAATGACEQRTKTRGHCARRCRNKNARGSRYWVSERSFGSFARSFSFQAPISHDNISADLTNGVLEVRVPKSEVPAPRRIQINRSE